MSTVEEVGRSCRSWLAPDNAARAAAARELGTADLRVCTPAGELLDGEAYAERLLGAPDPGPELGGFGIEVEGRAAVVRGELRPSRGEPLRFTSLWLNEDGEWRCATHHETEVEVGK